MKLDLEKVLVVGAGKSGTAAARFLAAKGAEVELTDAKGEGELGAELASLAGLRVKFSLGAYPSVERGKYSLVVVSPGVPLSVPPVARARELGIPVVGELELAFRFLRAPVVAVTGTNGKTTTTALAGEIFREAGFSVLVAGNIGRPLISGVEGDYDLAVLEVSSFQLETAVEFRPRVGAVLNITPDHLDRHLTMENYVAAKARLFSRQGPEDYAVLNFDDPRTRDLASRCPGRVHFFSRTAEVPAGTFVRNGWVTAAGGGKEVPVLPAEEIRIPGAHNLENALAAAACARALGVGEGVIAGVLRTFAGVPHRLEFVAEIGGVQYVNDSKGTNPDASIKALEAYRQPVVLIAGGRSKGGDFGPFLRLARQKVRALVLLGECAGELETLARREGVAVILRAGDLPEAVRLAQKAARPGDVVLLSPACASWDMFKNYEERGDLFKQAVRELKKAAPAGG
jgi:UDP-N-acetylmuramoylalanine--D-glutamate ligase